MTDRLESLLAGTPVPGGRMHQLGEAVASGGAEQAVRLVPPGARDVVAEAARIAFIDGFNDLLLVAAVVAFAGALLALLLVRESDIVPPGPPPEPAGA